MTREDAIKTLKEADTCFCKHGAYKDCHSGCAYKDALDLVIKNLEDQIYWEKHEKWLRDEEDDPNAGKYYGDI